MAAPLTKQLRQEHGRRSLPVRKDDEVKITRGIHKGKEGKVTAVYRKKFVIYVDKITREKTNGATVNIPIDPSNVIITKPKLDKGRKEILGRAKASGNKGKFTTTDVDK